MQKIQRIHKLHFYTPPYESTLTLKFKEPNHAPNLYKD